jgi:hypothetical protein
MTTLTIEISEKAGKTLVDLVEQLGGKVIAVNQDDKKSKAFKKQQVLDEIEQSMQFVKKHEQGKVKGKSIEKLLDEL